MEVVRSLLSGEAVLDVLQKARMSQLQIQDSCLQLVWTTVSFQLPMVTARWDLQAMEAEMWGLDSVIRMTTTIMTVIIMATMTILSTEEEGEATSPVIYLAE